MTETMIVEKVGKSKFGCYIKDKAGNFTSSSEQVNGFLSNQVPCDIEITASFCPITRL